MENLDALNQLKNMLDSRDGQPERSIRTEHAAKLKAVQETLRAEYRELVEPALKELDLLERKLTPEINRVRAKLEVHQREGVSGKYIDPVVRTLGELNTLFFPIPSALRRVPGLIDDLKPKWDSWGKMLGVAEIRQTMMEGPVLISGINECFKRLVFQYGQVVNVPGRPVEIVSPPPAPKREPPKVITEAVAE